MRGGGVSERGGRLGIAVDSGEGIERLAQAMVLTRAVIDGARANYDDLDNISTLTMALERVMAGIVLTILPVLIVYLFCQKQIVKGVVQGAIK